MSAPDPRIDLRTLYIGQMGRCFACSQIMAPLPYGLSPDGWIRSYFHRVDDGGTLVVLAHASCNNNGQKRALTWRQELDYEALIYRAGSLFGEG
jgi:hypothetical protein